MRSLLYLPLCWMLSSCNSGPALPLGEDVLVKALADAHIVEAAVQNLSGTYKDSIKQVYYNQVFLIHNIQEADFISAVESLSNQPEHMEKIYKKVEQRLEKLDHTSIPETKGK